MRKFFDVSREISFSRLYSHKRKYIVTAVSFLTNYTIAMSLDGKTSFK